MEPQRLADICQRYGLQTRVKGHEVLIKDCTECGNPNWNQELNGPKGLWHCWACDSGGTVQGLLKRRFGRDEDIPVQGDANQSRSDQNYQDSFKSKSALEVPTARKYLYNRGFSDQEIHRFGLEVCMEKNHNLYARICIPLHKYWTGDHFGYVGRSYTNRNPKYLSNYSTKHIAGFREAAEGNLHVLTEGPFDGLRVNQSGFQAAVMLGLSGSPLDEFLMQLPPNDLILIMLDGEAKEQARQITNKIKRQHRRTGRIDLPEDMDPGMLKPSVVKEIVNNKRREL